jgi:glyoxylase-like metal-dependent hydrolase (beta-lactamase superfamily II)
MEGTETMKILPKVYQVLGGMYANINNIFIIAGDEGLVMIDTSDTEEDLEFIFANIKKWESSKITHVLLTHRHYGHIANAGKLREMGAVIIAGEKDADAIEGFDINQVNDFAPYPVKKIQPCTVDIRAKEGDAFKAGGLLFKAHHVPGHTKGSMFYETCLGGKRILFTGDVLNVSGDCRGALFGWTGGYDYDMDEYFDSIKRFSCLKCDVILPGHYQLCMQEGTRILQDAYAQALLSWRGPYIGEE